MNVLVKGVKDALYECSARRFDGASLFFGWYKLAMRERFGNALLWPQLTLNLP